MELDGEDVAGEDIAPLLHGPGGAALAAALIGCGFYDDEPEAVAAIIACDPARGTVRVAAAGGGWRRAGSCAGTCCWAMACARRSPRR